MKALHIRVVSVVAITLGVLLVFAYGVLVKAEKPKKALSIGERFHKETSLT